MTPRDKLVANLYRGKDPFSNFTYEASELDPQGWNSDHEFLTDSIRKLKPSIVLDIGVWKGGSSIHMAKILREVNPEGVVISIDTFLGDYILAEVVEWQKSLKRNEHGRPEFYKTFYANAMQAGVQDMIIPIHMDTASGLRYLIRNGFKADMIHHDAVHQEPDVYNDMVLFWDLLRDGGHLIVDDYVHTGLPIGHANNFDGLIRDVNRFSVDYERVLECVNPKARVVK